MDSTERSALFDDWLREHQGILFRIVRAYAFTPDDREDLFQELALQLWKSVPRFRGESLVTTWIYRVALYSAMAWSQRERTHKEARQPIGPHEHVLVQPVIEGDPRLDWIYEQIAKLDPVDRSLMLLHLEGLGYREIAATLGISESHVGVKLNRIKERLVNRTPERIHHGV